MRRIVLALLLLISMYASGANAQNWGGMAVVSATMGIQANRLCVGEASRGDLGCPTYAPSLTTAGDLISTGGLTISTVSLTTLGTTWGYLGSGASYIPNLSSNAISTSSLTVNGVSITSGGAGTGDAIISGTTNATVNSGTSIISLTTAGTTWGYFSNAASYLPKFTAGSISTTTVQVSGTTAVCGATNAGTIRYTSATTTLELCTGSGWQPMGVGIPAGTISAFASTTCPTGWSEYTAARGRFLRGIDNAAGNDPSGTRTPGDIQDDLLKSHTHGVVTQLSGAIGSNGSALSGNAAGGWQSLSTATGGAETRPKNVAVTFCQFNGTSNGWNNPLSGGSTSAAGATSQIQYNTSGSFDANAGLTWTNATQTLAATYISTTNISATTINGLPFTGSGAGTGFSIVSGSTNATVNSATSIISLTTGATTWGYLGSGASYLPNLTSNAISTTTLNGVSVSSYIFSSSSIPAFKVDKNGTAQTGIAASTYTKITFSNKVLDTQNNFNTSTSRFTPTVAGSYIFTGSAYCGSAAACWVSVYKNGVIQSQNGNNNNASTNGALPTTTIILPMNGSTDYIELWVYTSGSSLSGNAEYTNFSGSLLGGVGSGSGTSGTGVTALSALTDVTLSSPVSNNILVYDGSKWINKFIQDTVSTSTMVAGWPDAIKCNVTSPAWGEVVFYPTYFPNSGDGKYYYRANIQNGTAYGVYFNSNGTYSAYENLTTTNCNVSISSLYASGRAFNNIGGAGAANSSYGLTSGTLALTLNSPTSIISLTTGVTTWGYLGATANYLPYLSSNAISTTNISATTINGISVSALGSGGSASPTNVPAFRVHKNGTNQTVTASTWTKLTFSTKTFDIFNNFDTTTSRFTPTVAGRYLYAYTMACSGGSTTCSGSIRKNGTDAISQQTRDTDGAVNIAGVLDMNGTTDYVEAWAYNTGATVISGADYGTNFSGSLLASGNGTISGTGVSALTSLTDVSVTTPISGTVLTYNGGTSKWEAMAATGGLGYAITSGTTAVTVNSATSIISLSTVSTTWGYLGSAASYIPNLTTNALTVGGLTINSSSLVSSTAQVAFSVHKNNVNQTVVATTTTKLTFSTKLFDTNNNFDTTTSRFTPTVAGRYFINLSVHCPGSTPVYCQGFIYKNGVSVKTGYGRTPSGTGDVIGNVSMIIDMNGTTDYIEAYAQNGGGTTISGADSVTRFEGFLLNGGGGSGGGSISATTTLSALTDVSLSSPTSGTVLTYNGGTSKWEAMAATGGLGYAITSGTTAVTVNSATSIISLSTVSTTWGYLGATASYIPNLTTNALTVGGLTINSTTLTSNTAQVAFSVNKNGTAQTITAGTATKLTWSTKVFDTNNNFDLATGRFTPTVAGKYVITLSNYCGGSTTACYSHIYKNGALVQTFYQATSSGIPNGSVVVDMNGTTDYVEAWTQNTGGTSISGVVHYTYFQGALLGGNGSGSGGAGVSAIASLTDVSLSSPASNNILVYNGSSWVNKFLQDTVSTTTQVTNWPDAITCTISGVDYVFPMVRAVSGGGALYKYESGSSIWNVAFSNGAANGDTSGSNSTVSNCTTTISSLYASGRAFNYIGGSGSANSSYGLTSGTLAFTLNSPTSIISLTTGATTWGYLGATANYLPYLSSNAISTTNISATTINGIAISSLGGGSASPTNVPSFRVHRNSVNQTATNNGYTKMLFTTKVFDTMSNFNTSTSQFQPTVAGNYIFTVSGYCSVAATTCYVYVYKNGSSVNMAGAASVTDSIAQATAIIPMNGTTDYVEAYVYMSGSTTLHGDPIYTNFAGSLLASGNGLVSGTATPAGSTGQIQYNTAGALDASSSLTFTAATQTLSTTNVTTNLLKLNDNSTAVCDATSYNAMKVVGGRLYLCVNR